MTLELYQIMAKSQGLYGLKFKGRRRTITTNDPGCEQSTSKIYLSDKSSLADGDIDADR